MVLRSDCHSTAPDYTHDGFTPSAQGEDSERLRGYESPSFKPLPLNCRLPQELADMIVFYFIHDIRTLMLHDILFVVHDCPRPHLHHSLTITDYPLHPGTGKHMWPVPPQNSPEFDLLPLVGRFHIRLVYSKFTLDSHPLCCFPALTNLQELRIDRLQLPSFMRDIRQCFEHLAPTLRFLAPWVPAGRSCISSDAPQTSKVSSSATVST